MHVSSKEVLSPARVKWYVPSGVHDDVGLELAAVVELEASLREALDLAVVLDLDLAVDDQLARAHVCAVQSARRVMQVPEAGDAPR